jgi:hypothetical protein
VRVQGFRVKEFMHSGRLQSGDSECGRLFVEFEDSFAAGLHPYAEVLHGNIFAKSPPDSP